MRKKLDVGILFDSHFLGKTAKEAKGMVEDDKVRERRRLRIERSMKKQGITVAERNFVIGLVLIGITTIEVARESHWGIASVENP